MYKLGDNIKVENGAARVIGVINTFLEGGRSLEYMIEIIVNGQPHFVIIKAPE